MNSINQPNAKRVFKGLLYDVWQWEQLQYDGSTKIFEQLSRPDTTNVIATVGDKIIIEKQTQPGEDEEYFSLPGGRCDNNEDPLLNAQRELLEETGYTTDNWRLFTTHQPVKGIMAWQVFIYLANNCRLTKPQQLDSGEKIQIELLSWEDFLLLSDNDRFYAKELSKTLLRARYESAFGNELKKIIFNT